MDKDENAVNSEGLNLALFVVMNPKKRELTPSPPFAATQMRRRQLCVCHHHLLPPVPPVDVNLISRSSRNEAA